MTQRKIQYWVIPPSRKNNSEYVARMEDVLELYAEPYDPLRPVLCMDEQPITLHRDVYSPIPASEHHAKRVDYEYERVGTVSLFMHCEPIVGWRQTTVRERRTKIDWAQTMAEVIRTRYAEALTIRLVCDNLNTHTPGAFYEAFDAPTARSLVERLEFHYTPKHGSWLNVAESELSVLTRQCITNRRLSDLESVQQQTQAWTAATNNRQRPVNWQFKTDDARIKLKSLYPNS
ncbi:MAG: IS630 family transposase [Cyanobacteria bacterium J06588_5]